MSLKDAAQAVVKTADKLAQQCEEYMAVALAEARVAGRDNTGGGMSRRQLRDRLQAEIISRLSPKASYRVLPGTDGKAVLVDPVLEFPGAVEARKYAASRGLPGLPS